MDNDDESMLCLSVPEKVDTNDDFPSSDDSDLEVTSTINEEENELVQIGNNLCLNSDDSTDDDMNIQDNSTTNRTITSAILLQAQKETHRHLQSFTGDLTQDADEYIERIENIGSLTNEPGEVLHILLKEKLSGQAERCTLDNRKQEAHESVNDYYDVVCRLCRRIDSKMSKQMILHFLQKEHVEKMNQSLDTNNTYFNQPTQSYMMTSAVNSSLTAKQYTNHIPPLSKPYPINQSTVYDNSNYHQPVRTNNTSQSYGLKNRIHSSQEPQVTSLSPCLICGLRNHRTIECYQRQPDGCFKCGHGGHRVVDCPQVFF
ncbi:unnamed protein product [Rotaria magnacalcarata]|uniref:CCHC-type domain-containing protein n=1 Tax=Rotaria magnacalcarata TaxID=392030 RepID=A0A815YMN7_9BILA|nr:unnamed protein product [Rotaria magnacalcarata]